MLDFNKVRNKELTLAELCQDLEVEDLRRLTDEMIDMQLELIAEAVDEDVVFTPIDPDANDPHAENEADTNLAWTLGHVIVHATASSEESAAQAANLARGVSVEGRNRFEVDWKTVTRVDQLHQRLEESRRIRQAYLSAWPDKPHLEKTYTPGYPNAKPRNPIMQFISGLAHDETHLSQLTEIMRQARAERSPG